MQSKVTIRISPDILDQVRDELKQQLFFCEAYACTLIAYVCSERRRTVGELKEKSKTLQYGVPCNNTIEALKYKRCADCTQDWPDFERSHRNTPKKFLPMPASKVTANSILNSPVVKVSRKRGPTSKVPPERCPVCNYLINQRDPYRRYNYTRKECRACTVSKRNHEIQARLRAALNVDIVCDHRHMCNASTCKHAVPHKHQFGKRMIHRCTVIDAAVTCNFDTTND